ncbi:MULTISPECIES: hypothetical protein [Shewanella]|uniref:hypothetical protein n=1 Tax=Shewanella TaxID=22 RepID=UPI000646C5D2|nr:MULTISPECIES: hypothetical protein [Shewanella]PZP38264.1 MAG: hypothetical protein DI594_00655 [Shewanella oneidensis]MCT8862118.1 hypothetical protein [Shewanella xiamenensis]MCT8867400.1 hypothetical protein [Shewanella xiamenensis]MCT8875422.1 hypothetical protein [Shewanella xiamenensis]NSM25892.1 hypothetical protein [Shewanella sp. ZOR0012]
MDSQQTAKYRALGLLLLAFIAPVVIAKLVLSMHWYQGGSTNYGELISPETSYTSLGLNNPQPKEWQLLYLLPAKCDEACRERLYILRQSHTALGPDQARVEPLILVNPDSDLNALTSFNFNTQPASQSLSQWLDQQQLIIVDPLGALVLRYPQVQGKAAHLAQGKALVADLRKLLKLSRVD